VIAIKIVYASKINPRLFVEWWPKYAEVKTCIRVAVIAAGVFRPPVRATCKQTADQIPAFIKGEYQEVFGQEISCRVLIERL
jgi:hypothetical protein